MNDKESTLEKALQLYEEAAERNSVLGLLRVARYTRSDELRKHLRNQNRDWHDLLNQARTADTFGQYAGSIEELAEEWRVEHSKHAEDKADYEGRAKSAKLVLLDWNWSRTASETFVEASGRVKNVSDESLRNVTAVVTYFTDEGKFITSDEAIISFNPILPGQSSPFRVVGPRNPAVSRASIEFKLLLDGTIPWVKQQKPD